MKKRVIFGLLGMAIIAGAILFVFNKPAKEVTKTARNNLKTGACDDGVLAQTKKVTDNLKSESDKAKYEASLQDLASCYLFRKDYQGAINAYNTLANVYKNEKRLDKETEIKNLVVSLEELKNTPKTAPPEDSAGKVLSN